MRHALVWFFKVVIITIAFGAFIYTLLLNAVPQAPAVAIPNQVLNLKYETSFVVFPQDCNANPPMLFGGKQLAEMDRCAGVTARRLLYSSEVKDYVTVGITDIVFHKPGYVKDLLYVSGTVIELGDKSIKIKVKIERENDKQRELITEGVFTFCAYDITAKKAVPHGLVLK